MKTGIVCLALLCAIIWAGCSGNKTHSEVSSADTTAVITSMDTTGKPRLVKTADMHFKVKNVSQVSEDISALTVKYKGMVMHHNMQSTINQSQDVWMNNDSVMRVSSYSTVASMVVKLPSAQMEEFMNQVSKMAVYVNKRNMDIEDESLDYLSAQMKFMSRSEIVAQQKTGRIKIKDPAAVMNLKDDLIDQQINNKRIDEAVKYSTIALSFYQSNTLAKEIMVNDDPSNFKLPFFSRLGHAIQNGWSLFTDAIIGLVNLWMFILAAVAGWLVYKYFSRKNTMAVM